MSEVPCFFGHSVNVFLLAANGRTPDCRKSCRKRGLSCEELLPMNTQTQRGVKIDVKGEEVIAGSTAVSQNQ